MKNAMDCASLTYKPIDQNDSTKNVNQHKLDYRKSCFCVPEIDGVKIITQKKNEILRILHNFYKNIFKLLSTEPGALLYQAYESFNNRDPSED